MPFFDEKTQTWKRTTPADGDLFDDEFDQLYANDNYLKDQLDTIQALIDALE